MNLEQLQKKQEQIQNKHYQEYFTKHPNSILLSPQNSHILLRSATGFLQHYTIQPVADDDFLKHLNQLDYLGLTNTQVSNINYRDRIKVIPTKLGKQLVRKITQQPIKKLRKQLIHKDIRHKYITKTGFLSMLLFIIIAMFDFVSMLNTQIQVKFYPEVNFSMFVLLILGLTGITLYTYITNDTTKYLPKITVKQIIEEYKQTHNQEETQQEIQKLEHEFLNDIQMEQQNQRPNNPTCF